MKLGDHLILILAGYGKCVNLKYGGNNLRQYVGYKLPVHVPLFQHLLSRLSLL